MFLVGLEFRPDYLGGSAKSVIIASQTSIVAPFLLGGLLAWGLYPRLGEGVPRLPFVLFLGAAMGITAFPVLAHSGRSQVDANASGNACDLVRGGR
jgi:Kef-type K+ transport system membrane component KefB